MKRIHNLKDVLNNQKRVSKGLIFMDRKKISENMEYKHRKEESVKNKEISKNKGSRFKESNNRTRKRSLSTKERSLRTVN